MTIRALTIVVLIAAGAATPAVSSAQSACRGPSNAANVWRDAIIRVATPSGAAADEARAAWNLPQVPAADVQLVSDSTTCAQALGALAARDSTARGPVLLYRVGPSRYILRAGGTAPVHFELLHVLDATFAYLRTMAL